MDADGEKALKLSCSWENNVYDKTTDDILNLIAAEESDDFELQDDELVSVERSVNFSKPNVSENDQDIEPSVSLHVKNNTKHIYMKSIILVCEVRIIEIFGENGIYLRTVRGICLDDSNEIALNKFRINFQYPIKGCSIKLLLNPNQDSFWICGIHVLLSENKTPPSNTTINYRYVEDLLKDSKISNSAKNCIEFLKRSADENLYSVMTKSNNDNNRLPDKLTDMSEMKNYIDYKFEELKDLLQSQQEKINNKINLTFEKITDLFSEHERKLNDKLNSLFGQKYISTDC